MKDWRGRAAEQKGGHMHISRGRRNNSLFGKLQFNMFLVIGEQYKVMKHIPASNEFECDLGVYRNPLVTFFKQGSSIVKGHSSCYVF